MIFHLVKDSLIESFSQFHLKSTGNAVNKLFELLSAMYAVVLGGILKHG